MKLRAERDDLRKQLAHVQAAYDNEGAKSYYYQQQLAAREAQIAELRQAADRYIKAHALVAVRLQHAAAKAEYVAAERALLAATDASSESKLGEPGVSVGDGNPKSAHAGSSPALGETGSPSKSPQSAPGSGSSEVSKTLQSGSSPDRRANESPPAQRPGIKEHVEAVEQRVAAVKEALRDEPLYRQEGSHVTVGPQTAAGGEYRETFCPMCGTPTDRHLDQQPRKDEP